MRRVAATDPTSICVLANFYHEGLYGLQRDRAKAMELYVRAENRDMKRQGAILETWRHSPEIWNELLNIGQLLHQLGNLVP